LLDEASSALDPEAESHLYRLLQETGCSYVSVGHHPSLARCHDTVLELAGGGAWQMASIGPQAPVQTPVLAGWAA
jgi:putative ATP-binding cassette transporter